MKLLTAWVMVLLVIAFISTTANAAQFISLGAGTFAEGVSGDGSTAVGWGPRSFSDALLWTSNGDMLNLGDLPGNCCSTANAASWNGSVVVGESSSLVSSFEAFRWTDAGGMQGLGVLPGMTDSVAIDTSANGTIVVGVSVGDGDPQQRPLEAFRWTEGVGMVGLGTLPGDIRSSAIGVAAIGSVVAGVSSDGSFSEAFRWTEGVGMVGLGTLPGDNRSYGSAISADGSVVVGYSYSDDPAVEAFHWTEGVGMVGLGTLPGDNRSQAFGVSADGSVVVGHSEESSGGEEEAFVWDKTNGMRHVEDVLTAAGLDMSGWRLRFAKGVSDDGNVIAGWGVNPSGGEEGWMARLDPTASPDFNGDGLLDCVDIDALVAEIVEGTHDPAFDLTSDGLVNNTDLDEWRVQGGAANLPAGNPYLVGDATLDGIVDGEDFLLWDDNKFTSTAAWCSGDFNADGLVDGEDFLLWNTSKFTSSDVASVPEPCAGILLISALIGLAVVRRS